MNYSQDSPDIDRPVRSDGGWVQTGARIKPHLEVRDLNAKDEAISVISGSQEDGRIIVTTRNGIKQSVVNKLFKKDEDLASFRESFKDRIETYKFDQVFGINSNQDKIYQVYFSEATKQLFSGINASFLIYGPSGAGKSFSFSGNEAKNEKGIVFKACEDIMQNLSPHLFGGQTAAPSAGKVQRPQSGQLSSKLSNLKVSVYSIYQDEVFDLLHSFSPKNIKQSIRELYEKSNAEVKIMNITKRDIKMISEFKQTYSQAIQNLLFLGEQLKEQNIYGKSHIVVQFEVQTSIIEESSSGKEKNKITKLSVIRLADTDIYENTQESIKNDFVVLKKYLQHCSRYNEISSTYKIYKQSKFTFALRDTLNEIANIRLLCCVTTNPAAYISSIKTIEFFGRMTTGHDRSQLQQSQSGYQRWNTQEESRISHHQNNASQNSPSFTGKFRNNSYLNNNNTLGSNTLQQNSVSGNNIPQQELTAQKQKEMESLIVEAENLVTDLTKNQENVPRLSLKEKNTFLSEKQAQLKELIGSLDINSYNQPLNQVNYCDTLLQNASRMLSRMASPSTRLGSNLRSFHSDSSDEEVQQIKQKIDRQISRLQDTQTDKSRDIISGYTSPQRLNSSVLKSPVNRVSSLTSPINRTIRNQSITNFQNQTLQNTDQQLKIETLNNEQEKLASSFSNLKKSMQLKEDLEYQRRRQDEFEMRSLDLKLKDQVIRNQDLEEQVRHKEEVIHQIDREMKNCQDDLLVNMEKMREMELKHDNWARLEQQLRENNEVLKQKILKKKKKIQTLKLSVQSKNKDYIELEDNLSSKIDHLQRVLNECQHSLDQSQRTSNDLNEELQNLRKKIEIKDEQVERFGGEIEHLRTQNSRLVQKLDMEMNEKLDKDNQIKSLSQRFEESKDLSQSLEAKLQKLRATYDIEKEDYKKQIDNLKKKRKEKIKKFKQFINEQEDRIVQLENEKIHHENHVQQAQVEQVDNRKEIESLKENLKLATQEIVITKQNSNNYQIELERLQNLVTSLENKIKNLESGTLEDARTIQQLRKSLEEEESSNIELRDINKKLEIDLQNLEEKQNEEITAIEKQVDILILDINSSKALNEEYKIKDEGYRKQIVSLNDVIESYKEKYYKAKHSNKALKSQIKNLEDKFKAIETQKLLELKELEKNKLSQKVQEQKENKLKVIDEIQGLISTHKKIRFQKD
ncbi:kinesin motor catalytic domain protein (macronuclear) [Tetrahymena thermophila SB210]|uniref:Kinesin motor catalytic domain protein n=1 Tax=Tetrahymena thermophila (strain SB210) TaxID=312017 RepID=I7MDG0_TETTS|nr:kinesin motor catalytic domain protein [Tetrahymena thermophila SB210]EAR87516.3 kinesin motor catalytic domain protein [Tetrahymena thermophila SB210]|eukprot:XP_001007761.3 kinesin motor catalytic domain protein [Tetrahymena thermophila SB210]